MDYKPVIFIPRREYLCLRDSTVVLLHYMTALNCFHGLVIVFGQFVMYAF